MAKSVIKKAYMRDDVIMNTSVASRTNFNILKGSFVVASLRVVFKPIASERFFVNRPGCYCEFTKEVCSEDTLIKAMEILQEFLNDNNLEYRGTMTRVFPTSIGSYHRNTGFKAIQFKLPKKLAGKFLLYNDKGKIRIISYKQFKSLSKFLDGKVEIIALDDFSFNPTKSDVAFVSLYNITQEGNGQYYFSNNKSSLHISNKESMKNITVRSSSTSPSVPVGHIGNSLIENEQKFLFPKVEHLTNMEGNYIEVNYSFDNKIKLHKIKFNLQLKDYEDNQKVVITLPKAKSSGIDYPYEIARNVNRKGIYISLYVVESFIRSKFKLSSGTSFNTTSIEGKEFYKFINDVKKKRTLEFMKKKYAFMNGIQTKDEQEAKKLGVPVEKLKEEKLRLAEIFRKEKEKERLFGARKQGFSNFIINIILGDYGFAKKVYQNNPVIFNEIMNKINARESTIRLIQRKKGGNAIKGESYSRIRASIHRYVTPEKIDWIKEEAYELMDEISNSNGHVRALKEFRKEYKASKK